MRVASSALAAAYDEIWSHGRDALMNDRVAPDPLPHEGGMRWGISAVFRPVEWSSSFADCQHELTKLLGPGHIVYGPESLHVTLQQFEGFRDDVTDDDLVVRIYAEALRGMAKHWMPVTVALQGLTASPAGVLVQGWPPADLQTSRADLHARVEASGLPMRGPEADRTRLRRTAHASLAIYGGPVDRADDLVAFIEDRRETDFGEQRFDRVWLVGYRRAHDAVELIEYDAFPLKG